MKNIIPILFFSFLVCTECFSQNPFTNPIEVRQTISGLPVYGIQDANTGKWLTPPAYKYIEALYTKNQQNQTVRYLFIANLGKSAVIIAGDGVTKFGGPFDKIQRPRGNDSVFIVKQKQDFFFFKPEKGILKIPGAFSAYQPAAQQNMWFIKKNGKTSAFNVTTGKEGKAFDYMEDRFIYADSVWLYIVRQNGKYGITDFNGKEIAPLVFDTICINEFITAKKNGKWGMLDSKGQTLQDFVYEEIGIKLMEFDSRFFNAGYCPAKLNGKWGVLEPGGKWAVRNEYDFICGGGIDGGHSIQVIKDGKMGIIEGNRIVFPFLYSYIQRTDREFKKTPAKKYYLVNNGPLKFNYPDGGKWGMADSSGKLVLEINAEFQAVKRKYDYVNMNSDDWMYGDSTLVGYVWNIGGKKILQPVALDSVEQQLFDPEGNPYTVKVVGGTPSVTAFSGGKSGLVALDGTAIIPIAYDDLKFSFLKDGEISDGAQPVAISDAGKIPRGNYDNYDVSDKFPVLVCKDKKWGAVNLEGKQLVPAVYDSISYETMNCALEANDSVYKARGYLNRYLRLFKNNLYGSASFQGTELCLPFIAGSLGRSLSFMSIDSIGKERNLTELDYSFGEIIVNRNEPKLYTTWITESSYDETGKEQAVTIPQDFKFYRNCKFMLQNICSGKPMSDQWADDILLIGSDLNTYHMNTLNGQLKFSWAIYRDSIFEKRTGAKLDIQLNRQIQETYLVDYYFLKSNGLWYLYHISNPKAINAGNGFEGVVVMDKSEFKAWRNNKEAYYSYTYKGPFSNEADVFFPDTSSTFRIMMRSANPGAKEFNLLDEKNKTLLPLWAESVVVPSSKKEAMVFENEGSFRYYQPGDMLQKVPGSIAIKQNKKWLLVDPLDPSHRIGNFNSVEIRGKYWLCLKKKKKIYYTIDGLTKANPFLVTELPRND